FSLTNSRLSRRTGLSRKQRQTLKRLRADMVVLGFTGSYGRVSDFVRGSQADRVDSKTRSVLPTALSKLQGIGCAKGDGPVATCIRIIGRSPACTL
ncbi:MAG TPA: hypothetical protein DDW73_17615, partial [Rhizobium sp.]|nr:hypothetical protein [Rhizobium sp.]